MLLQEKYGFCKLFYIIFFSPPDIASILSFCHLFLDVNYQVKIWADDKLSFSLTKSFWYSAFRWQTCHRKCCFCMKKAVMILSSLPLKMDVPCGNRTHNYSLGGYCYIHLTKGTNGFATSTIIIMQDSKVKQI